jgi:hypothetical protein
MCDGCGCNTPKTPLEKAHAGQHEALGWHVHADGTSHQHNHAHDHQQPGQHHSAATAAPPPETAQSESQA